MPLGPTHVVHGSLRERLPVSLGQLTDHPARHAGHQHAGWQARAGQDHGVVRADCRELHASGRAAPGGNLGTASGRRHVGVSLLFSDAVQPGRSWPAVAMARLALEMALLSHARGRRWLLA